MQKVDNPEQFREKVIERLENKLSDKNIISKNFQKMAKNLETGIYNFTIQDASTRNVVK